MEKKIYKIVTFAPVTHADQIREAIGKAGAGRIGEYGSCTFSTKGVGRFKGSSKTKPFRGKAGSLESIEEERIETVCPEEKVKNVIVALKRAHPYEEIPIDIYPLERIEKFL